MDVQNIPAVLVWACISYNHVDTTSWSYKPV